MRLDHVSYVASHNQISDVVNRIGSQIGTAFVDGGIHPKFGTRNFTAPLLNGQYIEVVCPLDHPATDSTPFGKAVKQKANEGGGWLTWVFSVKDIDSIEKKIGRKSIDGIRLKPDGTKIKWKQVGVSEILQRGASPFFIQWQDGYHPSSDGIPQSQLQKIYLSSLTSSPYALKEFSTFELIKAELDQWAIECTGLEDRSIESIEFILNGNSVTIL